MSTGSKNIPCQGIVVLFYYLVLPRFMMLGAFYKSEQIIKLIVLHIL